MKVSIIIPTYRPIYYLWECLGSLNKQTYSKEHFEILLVLNGEKEPYYGQIQEFLDSRISNELNVRLFYSEIAGVSNARNIGINNALGQYITFIDDDDYVSENYIEELLSCSSCTNIGCAHPIAFNKYGIIKYSVEKAWLKLSSDKEVHFLKARKLFQGPCMKLIHRNIIGNHRFDIRFQNGEDSLFMFLISNKFDTISATSESAIYFRRVRTDSAAYRKKTFYKKFQNSLRLVCMYTYIFFSQPFKYNFNFYFTRIIGAIKMFLK